MLEVCWIKPFLSGWNQIPILWARTARTGPGLYKIQMWVTTFAAWNKSKSLTLQHIKFKNCFGNIFLLHPYHVEQDYRVRLKYQLLWQLSFLLTPGHYWTNDTAHEISYCYRVAGNYEDQVSKTKLSYLGATWFIQCAMISHKFPNFIFLKELVRTIFVTKHYWSLCTLLSINNFKQL